MDTEALAARLTKEEGLILHLYEDSRGHPTYCSGHLKTAQDSIQPGQQLALGSCHRLLQADIAQAIRTCERLWPMFQKLPEEAQQALVAMAFTLGEQKLKRFTNLIAAIECEAWDEAARSMRRSRWYRQLGQRAHRLVEQIRRLAQEGH